MLCKMRKTDLFWSSIVVYLLVAGWLLRKFTLSSDREDLHTGRRYQHNSLNSQPIDNNNNNNVHNNSQDNNKEDDVDFFFGESVEPAELAKASESWAREYRALYNREPPTNYDKWLAFAAKRKCYMHPRYYAQIDNDLKPFRDTRITKRMLERSIGMVQKHPKYVNVIELTSEGMSKKNKRNVYLAHTWDQLFSKSLLAILPAARTITIVTNMEEARILDPTRECWNKLFDGRYNQTHGYMQRVDELLAKMSASERKHWLKPLFSQSKLPACHGDILITGPYHLTSVHVSNAQVSPWSSKLNRFTWRGSTTGLFPKMDGMYRHSHRFRFVEWAMNRSRVNGELPVTVDVGFTKTVQCEPDTAKQIRAEYDFKKPKSIDEQHMSKYVPVVDGNIYAARLLGYFYSNSALFVSTLFSEWYSKWVEPFKHFVPFDVDLSDLDANLRWAHDNDDKARQIGERASRFANKHLNLTSMQCYTGLLVLEYADLLE